MSFVVHSLPNGGIVTIENVDWSNVNNITNNYEVYHDKQPFEDRLAFVNDNTPDGITLPDAIGGSDTADITG